MTTPETARPQSRIESSPLYNPDLAPARADRRHWGTYNFAALWISMSVNILTYMLAASLIQGGMNWKQAVLTIFLGNVIVLAPMLLNSHPGAKYGVPFPVLARASFGVLGANIAAVLRALVACGWFGIQTWIGGEAISTLLATLAPGWKNFPHSTAVCFLLFLRPEITPVALAPLRRASSTGDTFAVPSYRMASRRHKLGRWRIKSFASRLPATRRATPVRLISRSPPISTACPRPTKPRSGGWAAHGRGVEQPE